MTKTVFSVMLCCGISMFLCSSEKEKLERLETQRRRLLQRWQQIIDYEYEMRESLEQAQEIKRRLRDELQATEKSVLRAKL